MTPPTFPTLPGQGWSVHKRPSFSTRVASHVSGREVRSPLWAGALTEFELTYDGLSASGYDGLGTGSLQALLGFVLACKGRLTPFLYVDPTDGFRAGQAIATGDGATTSFPVVRTLGAATETVSWVTSLADVAVGGAAISGWSLSQQPATLTLAAAPAAGASVTADVGYAYLCRFLDDSQDFENFAAGLWRIGSLKFRSVRA